MSIKTKTTVNRLGDLTATLQSMHGRSVKVGALQGEHAWLAGIHEHGADIKATNAEYLTIPVHHEAYGRKAGSFKDLFCIKSKKGNLLLVKKDGDGIIPYYWLTKSVKIPERAFLRRTVDEEGNRLMRQAERAIKQVINKQMDIDTFLDLVGEQYASAVKDKMRETTPNSPLTIAAKGSSTPLEGKTHGLINSITWEKD